RPAFVAGTVIDRQTTVFDDHVDYSVTVAAQASGAQGRWKGSWLVSWSEVDQRDVVWVSDALPPGADARGEGEDWTWVATDPVPYTGSAAHQSALAAGRHQHYFTTTDAAGVSVGVGAGRFVCGFLV